jgi:hypothetical protein
MAILQNSALDSYSEGCNDCTETPSVMNGILGGTCGMGLAVEGGLVVVKALLPSSSALRSGQVILCCLAWNSRSKCKASDALGDRMTKK